MKKLTFLILMLFQIAVFSQNIEPKTPNTNIRLSFLLFPFTPLLTLEVRTFDKITLQLETNFVNTHGANIKYFTTERMNGHYLFVGTALVDNKLLRSDLETTILPYGGYGYAHRFGNTSSWTFDSRIGLGTTTNADKNSIYPIIKTGIGRTF